jgi:carboxyl-terminal processing protease
MFLKQIVLMLFVVWFSATASAENQAIDRFFADFRTLVEEKYVNPNEINLESWLNNVEQILRNKCKDVTCYNSDFERILTLEVRKVNDPHFSVLSLQPDANDVPEITLGQESRSFRYGFQVLLQYNRLVVRYVQPMTPADRSGVRVGDEILSINDTRVPAPNLLLSIDRAEAQHLEVNFNIRRTDTSEINVKLAPESSKIWQPWYQILNSDTAILFVPSFLARDTTDVQTHRLVNAISKLGVKKLIIDLRINRGGTTYTVVNSVGAFLPEAKRIYKTKSGITFTYQFKNGLISVTSSAKPNEVETKILNTPPAQFKGSLRILVSPITVSGPENFAEILQNSRIARVIGETTAGGAGVTGEVFDLSSGGNLGLSTYRQYHADGSIVSTKVTPEIKATLDLDRLTKGEDTQVQAALQDFTNMP